MTRQYRGLMLICALLVIGVAACQQAEEKTTPTPNQDSIQAASTLFAQPSQETPPTPTATPVRELELELNRVIAQMEQAVLAGDYDGYMVYIWDGDPTYLTEQARWAADWQAHPLRAFDLRLNDIRLEAPNTAIARMTMTWSQAGLTSDGSAGGTTVSVVFYREDDQWLLGGENWQIIETGGINLYYFSDEILNNRSQAETVAEYLPAVHTRITREFDFVPDKTAQIKLYENEATLQTLTRLSIPWLTSWNEPGEAIKLTLGPFDSAPDDALVAREYTRFVLHEIGGGTHGNFPWWLEEGIAEYGGATFHTLSQRNRIIKQVAALAVAPEGTEQQILDWQAMQTRPTLPEEDLQQVAIYPAYTLVHYVTETYGSEARNAWIHAIATGHTLEEACPLHLGLSFDNLDAGWREWLPTQL
ncbi:MAG: hypothetical protein JXJ20_12755 [Anaerolineae bacterium]|nr:hypothetical protein [Anaerolineae bacterium]